MSWGFAMEHQIALSLVQLADLDVLFSSSHTMQPGPASQIPGPLPQAGTYFLRPRISCPQSCIETSLVLYG